MHSRKRKKKKRFPRPFQWVMRSRKNGGKVRGHGEREVETSETAKWGRTFDSVANLKTSVFLRLNPS